MAGKKIGAIIALDGEKEFRTAITGINKELSNLKSAMDLTKEKFAGQANSLEALKAKHEVLGKVLDAQKRKMQESSDGLQRAKDDYAKVGTGLEKLRKDYDAAKKKMEEMKKSSETTDDELKKQEASVKELADTIKKGERNYETAGKNITEWEGKLTKAETEVLKANRALDQNSSYMKEAENATNKCASSIDEFGKEVKRTETETKDFGQGAKAGVEELAGVLVSAGVAAKVKDVAAALIDCVDAANQFETGMAKTYTIADSGIVSVDNMKKSIIDLSNATGTASKAVAEDVYNAISAGQDTADAVNFTSNSTKLATAGFAETSQTLDVLTTILNAYGMESKDVTKVSDMLIQTQNKGKVTVAQLSSVMGKIIPTAKESKVPLEQLTAGYAIMTSKGIAAAETTTYMNSMLNELAKSGTIASTAIKESTGSSFQELMISGKSLGEVLDILQQQAGSSGKSLMDMFGSAEAGKAAASLLSGGVKGFNDQVVGMQNSAGATDIAFNKMSQTAEFAEKKFKTSADNLKIAIGEQLSPALKELHETGADAFVWAADFVKKCPAIVGTVTGLVTAVGVLATGVAGLIVAKKAAAAMQALNISLAANPALLAASAIAGLVVAIGTFIATGKDATDQTKELINSSDELIESSQRGRDERAQNRAEMENQYGAAKNLSDELYNLSEKENKSNVEKARMSEIVAQLNQQMPDLNLSYDDQADKLNMTSEAMDKYIESMKSQAIAAAAQEDINRISAEQFEIEKKKYELENKQKDLKEQITAATTKNGRAMSKVTEEIEKTGSATVDTERALQDSSIALDQLNGEYKKVTDSIADQDEEAGKLRDELTATSDIVKRNADETGILAGETDNLADSSTNAAEAQEELNKAAEEMAEKIQAKYTEMRQAIEQNLSGIGSVFDEFKGGTEITTAEMQKNIDSQIEGLTNWRDNIKILAAQTGEGMSTEFLNYLIDLGPEGANAVQSLIDALEAKDGSFEKLSRSYAEEMKLKELVEEDIADTKIAINGGMEEIVRAEEAALEKLNGAWKKVDTEKGPMSLKDAMDKAVSEIGNGGNALGDAVRTNFGAAVDTASQIGAKIPEDLAANIANGSVSAADAIQIVNSSINGRLQEAIQYAEESGVNIPQSIRDGIASGQMQPVDAINQINALLAEAQQQGITNAGNSGKTSADIYAEKMQAQTPSAKAAGSNVAKGAVDGANTHQGEFATAGQNAASNMASGINTNAPQVAMAAGMAASNANNSASSYQGTFNLTGGNLALGMAGGFIANSPAVVEAARAAVAKAVAAAKKEGGIASPSKVFHKEVGIFLPKGMAMGIREGIPEVARSARDMAMEAIAVSKKEFDVNSPSRVFIKMGKNLGEGLEIGIKGKTKAAVKASSKMAKEVYKEASSWLTTYKKTHDVTLAQEESFWRKVAKTVKKGSKEYAAAIKNVNKIKNFENQVNSNVGNAFGVSTTEVKNKKTVEKDPKKYYSELTKAANTYIENKKKTDKVTLQQEKYFWEQVKSNVDSGSQTYADASGKIKSINKKISADIKSENKKAKDAQKKAAEAQQKAADKSISSLENSIEEKKKYSSITAAEETAMWDKLIKQAEKKGGKYASIVKKQAKAAKKEIAQANKEYGLSGSGLDMYKTYYNVSAFAEMEYWDKIRGKKGLTDAQKIEADQKYLEAKKSYNEQMKDLEDDYYDKCKDVNEKLADDIKDLTDAYDEAVSDRKQSIKSAFGTFDEFKSESEGPEKLLANMESQVAGYALWEQQLEELSGKGVINPKFMEELQNMGPEAAATIMSLNMMTDEQLKRADEAWKEKDRLAESRAVKENEALRIETENKIKALKEAAQKELDAYKAEFDSASKVLSAAMEAPLKELANKALTLGSDATAKFILGVGNKAKSSDTTEALKGATRQLAQGLNSLPKAGKEIGKDTLAGILNGMSNKLEIKKGAKSIVAELEKAIKKEAGINSPSRRFKESIGLQIPAGVAQGVEEGAEKASRSGAQMIRTMLERSKSQLKDQQSALADYSSKLNWSDGIEALNRIISVSPTQVQNIKVDNSGMSDMFQNMIEMLQEMNSNMGNMRVVLEDGTLVGKIAPAVGSELTALTRGWI